MLCRESADSVTGALSTREPTREFAMATAIALIDATGIRSGTSRHARLSGARGAVTLLKSNVRISGRSITLTFKAKGGKHVVKDVPRPAAGSGHQGAAAAAGPPAVSLSGCRSGRAIRVREVNASFATWRRASFVQGFPDAARILNVVETLLRIDRGGRPDAAQTPGEASHPSRRRRSGQHRHHMPQKLRPRAVVEAFEQGKLSGVKKSSSGRYPPARRILAEVVNAQEGPVTRRGVPSSASHLLP